VLGIDGSAQPTSLTCPIIDPQTGEVVNATRVTCREGGYLTKDGERQAGFGVVTLHCINALPWAYAHGKVNLKERQAAHGRT
jgi:hypothetical protein